MPKAICSHCSMTLELPPEANQSRMICPRCQKPLVSQHQAEVNTAETHEPSEPGQVTDADPGPRRDGEARREGVKQKRKSRSHKPAHSSRQVKQAGDRAGMAWPSKAALIGAPGVIVLVVVLLLSQGNSSKEPTGQPGSSSEGSQQVQLLGAAGQGRRFAFIADRSSSMNGPVNFRPAWTWVNQEVLKTIKEVKRGGYFYVACMGEDTSVMPRGDTWVEGGGDLTDIEGWIQSGKAKGKSDPLRVFEKVMSLDPAPDAIFFMTDGSFADEHYTAARAIAKLNASQAKKIPIHVIFLNTAYLDGWLPSSSSRYSTLLRRFDLPPMVQSFLAIRMAILPVRGFPDGIPDRSLQASYQRAFFGNGPGSAARFAQLEEIAFASEGSFRWFDGLNPQEVELNPSRLVPVLAVHDAIILEDPVYPGLPKVHNWKFKAFPVSLKAGVTYQIDMVSSWDAFLVLEDPMGRMVAQDNDGGQGRNALITFTPSESGAFRIIATHFHGGLGVFTVTVVDRKL